MSRSRVVYSALVIMVLCSPAPAKPLSQEPNATAQATSGEKAAQRDLDAVNYIHRRGSTRIGFKGTTLLPQAKGEAKLTSESGGFTIAAKLEGLIPPSTFGPEYLTYVLWAISPDGRPNNLGEIAPEGNKSSIEESTALQSFGLIVTAEPYFSVTQPSDVVVLENVIIQDKTTGILEKVNAHYSPVPRGAYAETPDAKMPVRNERSPHELYQAYNAVRIAQAAGADKYAADIFQEAKRDLQNAADIDGSKKPDRKMEITYARQAVERSEDARLVTLRKQAAEQQLNAEIARRDAQNRAQTAESQSQRAQLEAERARAAQAEAEARRAHAEAVAAEATRNAQSVNDARERLLGQLNSVMATSESARGLIVNMSDVLFDTGKYTLKPDTQIILAKVSGILLSYPGLKLQVEGYADNVGGNQRNQKLSENRARAVRDFLVKQGVEPDNITAAGFGKARPVADNGTANGRQQNRRVEMVVSGDAIGVHDSEAPATGATASPQ